MSDQWIDCLLGDILTLKRGYDLPHRDRVDGDVPIFSSSGVSGFHNQAKVSGPGVTTGRYGTLGEVFFVEGPFWPLNTSLCVQDFKGNDPRFISYFLQTLGFERHNVAGAVPGVNRNALHMLPVRVPPLKTQHHIAGILSAYDDLIENNTRRIRILEEMAQSLYREWFVHFRYPGHEHVPLIESSAGPIPEGWESVPFGTLLASHIGGGWGKEQSEERHSFPAYVIRGTDISGARHVQVDSCPLRYHTASNLRSRVLEPGDIVMEVSGGGMNQSVGRTLLITTELTGAFDAPVICASFCKRLEIDSRGLHPLLLAAHLTEAYGNGTIGQYEVQSTGIRNFKFAVFLEKYAAIVPKLCLQGEFIQQVTPMVDLVQRLGSQIRRLQQTRDLLLPRLISDEGLSLIPSLGDVAASAEH